MAKKTKDREKKSTYLEEKNKPKKKARKKTQSEKNLNKSRAQEDPHFSFDNEIVIGVTKKEEPKKEKKNTKKNKKKQIQNKKKVEKQNKRKQQAKPILSQEELEKRNKKRRRNLRILKYTMLCALFIVVILCAMYSPLFNIKTIEVTGNNKITNTEIISLSQIKMDQNTFQLSKNKIKEQIQENAYIEEVTIKRKLPSTVILQIEERKPVYLVEYAGSYVYIDKQGHLLEISTEKLELPILQGVETETANFIVGNRLCKEDLVKLSTVLKIVELAQSNEIIGLITRIDIEEKENVKLILETKEKTVYLGDSSNLNMKMLTIKAILEKTEGQAGEIFVNMNLNNEDPIFRERV